jgi:uncharacterized membrane-anchored protein
MIPTLRLILCGAAVILATPAVWSQAPVPPTAEAPADSQEKENPEDAAFAKFMASIDWKTEGSGDLGGRAALTIPAGYRFTGSSGTVKLMEAYGNLTSGSELGYIEPVERGWFAVFEFDECGYVKDDEKNKLDADAILKQMKEAEPASNKRRAERGMSPLNIVGWQTPPFYNPQTKNLEWAIRLASEGGESINYRTKLLGRRGVMEVVLACDEKELAAAVPAYQELLKGFSFNKEENYASFSKGDKVAEYGLTGLIVGGGLLVAAKSGLLAKLFKPILIGLVAVGAFFKRIFTGRSQKSI